MLAQIQGLLLKQKATVAVAESCTGGKICATLVSFPGISEVFNEGYITYSNAAKVKNLGVSPEVLEEFGAVSEQCASQMSEGAAKAAKASYGLATTGIAGPDGGTDEKPVGTVYISCSFNGQAKTLRCQFGGDREAIRNAATQKALDLLLECILSNEENPCAS